MAMVPKGVDPGTEHEKGSYGFGDGPIRTPLSKDNQIYGGKYGAGKQGPVSSGGKTDAMPGMKKK